MHHLTPKKVQYLNFKSQFFKISLYLLNLSLEFMHLCIHEAFYLLLVLNYDEGANSSTECRSTYIFFSNQMKKRLGILRRFFCKMTHAAAAIAPLPAKKTNYHTFNISCQALLYTTTILLLGQNHLLTNFVKTNFPN